MSDDLIQLPHEVALSVCDILGIAMHPEYGVGLRDMGHAWAIYASEEGSKELHTLVSRDNGINLFVNTPDGKQIFSTIESTNIMTTRTAQLQPDGKYSYGPSKELDYEIGEGIREMEQDIALLIRDYLQPRRPAFVPDDEDPSPKP